MTYKQLLDMIKQKFTEEKTIMLIFDHSFQRITNITSSSTWFKRRRMSRIENRSSVLPFHPMHKEEKFPPRSFYLETKHLSYLNGTKIRYSPCIYTSNKLVFSNRIVQNEDVCGIIHCYSWYLFIRRFSRWNPTNVSDERLFF